MRVRRLVLRIAVVLVAVVAVLFVAGVLSAGTACAHDPRFACSPRGADHPIVVHDPTKSWAFYGHLAEGQEDVYDFTVTRPARIPISTLIDVRDASNPARPVVTIRNANGKAVAQVDLAHPMQFFEPFSRVHYLSSPAKTIAFAPGAYTADVRMTGGTEPQRYTLAIGAEERFAVTEIPFVLGAIYRIHNRKF